jgi:hypothetical protein
MSRTFTVVSAIFLVCLALAVLGGLVWANTVFVRTQPLEKDFLVPWLGARTFLQYGDSPYGEPATQRAQIVYYGRLAAPDQDPLTLWLPFPMELFYFPIALVDDYGLARAIWMTCLEIAMVVMGLLTLRLAGWKPGRLLLPIILLFPMLWVYGVISLASASAAGFVALGLVGFLLSLEGNQDELAGGLLILLVSAARATGVLAFFIFWWIFYRRRWRVLWGFLMGLAILLGVAFLLLPNWFLPFLRGLLLHFTYDPSLTSMGIFTSWSPVAGSRLGWVLAIAILLILFFEWGRTLTKDRRAFLWTACLTLSVTPFLGIPMHPKEYIFLFVPLALFLAILSEGRSRLRHWGLVGFTLLIILIGLWFLTYELLMGNNYAGLVDVLFLVLPMLLVIGLYWMRWRFTRITPSNLGTSP